MEIKKTNRSHTAELHRHDNGLDNGACGNPVSRRSFMQMTSLGVAGLIVPWTAAGLNAAVGAADSGANGAVQDLMQDLLKQWCDGMLAAQIDLPDDPARHGALACPSCSHIHGRCMDAVYPFFNMARKTGQQKYRDAGIAVFEWAERNVSLPNGGWSVIMNPQSWAGITVFGAIALADTLHYHGDLLDKPRRKRWLQRLDRAGDYLINRFPEMSTTNINYGCTMVHAMLLLGKILDRPDFIRHSHTLAGQFKDYLTTPNRLVYGEGVPIDRKSPRGLLPVDLGYNVEESLNGIALYAMEVQDKDLIDLVAKSMESHLEFMLPDGGWDNSWGTRMYKWTYWGSRTSDGCQPGYAIMRHKNPAFGTAVYQNTRLLQDCTQNGLLHGGPHYASYGAKPCIHHTFTHAKAIAAVLDHEGPSLKIDPSAVLPRMKAEGVKDFPEIATWLVARGPWRGTVTAYDWVYKKGVHQPSGGALSVLWHQDLGPVLTSSMSRYWLSEGNNMQVHPDGRDDPLALRVEAWDGGNWFTNLYDLKAEVTHSETKDEIAFQIKTRLLNENGDSPNSGPVDCMLSYRFNPRAVVVRLQTDCPSPEKLKMALVVPIISRSGEKTTIVSINRIEIEKANGKVAVQANKPLRIQDTGHERIFNLVPGFEAVPVFADIPAGRGNEIELQIMRS